MPVLAQDSGADDTSRRYAAAEEPPSASESAEAKGVSLEELLALEWRSGEVVTASGGTAESKALSSANVFVLSRAEIDQRGWRTLEEVLSNVPGLYVSNDGVQSAVSVRGISGGLQGGSRLLKVMINGVNVTFRPTQAAFLGPEFIPLEIVDRVEIAKGPLSALYGANAFLATVNVITRKPAKGPAGAMAGRLYETRRNLGWGGTVAAELGTENVEAQIAVRAERQDRSGLSVPRTFPNQSAADPLFSERSRGDLANPMSVYGRVAVQTPGFGRLAVQGGLQQIDSMGEFQVNSLQTHTTRHALRNVWLSARYEKSVTDAVSLWASLGWFEGAPNREDELYVRGAAVSSFFTRNFRYRALDASLGVETQFLDKRWKLDIGADFSGEDQTVLFYSQHYTEPQGPIAAGQVVDLISAQDRRKATLLSVGVFAQLAASPFANLPGLRFSAAGRLDRLNFFGLRPSWRAGLAYAISEDVSTRLILGSAYQTPSPVMMFGLPGFGASNNIIGGLTLPGQPALTPQNVQSIEAVFSAQAFKILAIELGAYVQQLDQTVQFLQLGSNFVARNQDTTRYAGGEWSFRLSTRRFAPYFMGAVQSPIASEASVAPLAFGILGADVPIPEARLNINLQARAATERGATQSNTVFNDLRGYTLAPYVKLDVSVSTVDLKFIPGAGETKFTLRARNLLDRQVAEPGFAGFDTPDFGRTVTLEIRQSI
ncbi:MAG: TonB-dependent receptor plug domain-containing protein [Myxococcaceae bacterium]